MTADRKSLELRVQGFRLRGFGGGLGCRVSGSGHVEDFQNGCYGIWSRLSEDST